MNRNTINAAFKENGNSLVAGRVISEEQLCEWFGIKQPELAGLDFNGARKAVQTYQFEKLAAYGGLNKLLRPIGMVMSQRKNDYIVKGTIVTVRPVINSYKKRAQTLVNNAQILSAGIRG